MQMTTDIEHDSAEEGRMWHTIRLKGDMIHKNWIEGIVSQQNWLRQTFPCMQSKQLKYILDFALAPCLILDKAHKAEQLQLLQLYESHCCQIYLICKGV